MHSSIADRFDLTLECIRRHYAEPSAANPLGERLAYYADFFQLFGDFDRHVRFFLLDDPLTEDRRGVRSLMSGEPLTAFPSPAFASTPGAYAEYRTRSIAFVMARNDRIRRLELWATHSRICRRSLVHVEGYGLTCGVRGWRERPAAVDGH